MPKAVKLADIANKLGVSTVTVSKALSGQRGVSDEVRAKIKQLAEEMGYVKTVGAEKAKERKSYTIGIVAAERYLGENQSFYWRVYRELSQRAMRKNCFAMLEVISFDEEQNMQMPKMVTEEKVDAVIVLGTFKVEFADYLRESIKLPVVLLDTPGNDDESDSVVSNNLMGAYRMTNYLFQLGHSKIGFVGTRLTTASIDDRYFGYLKSMMHHGIKVPDEWIIDDRNRETGQIDYSEYCRLPAGDMPTAYFCNNDIAAMAMIRRLTESGYGVPEDVSVVGFDNYVNEPFVNIGITTYAINTKEMARRAVHILVHKLENPDYSTGVYMIGGKFIERESAKKIGPPIPFV